MADESERGIFTSSDVEQQSRAFTFIHDDCRIPKLSVDVLTIDHRVL